MMKKLIAVAALCAAGSANAALSVGDVAIIGRINNGSPDTFSFVSLADIAAGEKIYFTDNGWTGSAFRGATATDGDGNENLTVWTATANIAAGSIVNSNASSSAWTWTTSGSVPGGTSGSFANLALSQTGEQIYAFQSTSPSLPLTNIATHLFVLDDTNGFETATSSSTGSVPAGLSGSTALTFNFASSTFISVKSSVLSGSAKTKAQWLDVFADANNWATGSSGALATGNIAVAVPEADTWAMLLAGLGLMGFVARRRTH